MKRSSIAKILLVLALAFCTVLSLAACGGEDECEHSFADGKCTLCGALQSTGLYFTSNGDGTCQLSLYNGVDAVAIIPSTSPEGDTVTSIGKEAFLRSGIESVVIPSTVTEISQSAFLYCYRLNSITIPESVTAIGDNAFQGCSSLTSITIPESVTAIGTRAFFECTALATVNLHDGLTSLGSSAFRSTAVTFSEYESVKYLGTAQNPYAYLIEEDYAYGMEPTICKIHEDTVLIADYAFYGNVYIQFVNIPASVKHIGESAFEKDSMPQAITILTLPEGLLTIGDDAFRGCANVAAVVIPSTVTEIGDRAFADCSRISAAIIPESVEKMGSGVFEGCTSLKTLTIPQGVTFEYAYENSTTVKLCSDSPIETVYFGGTLEEWLAINPEMKLGHVYNLVTLTGTHSLKWVVGEGNIPA